MTKPYIIGIMGLGEGATAADLENAEKLGYLIAKKGWTTLTGGMPTGVMEAALIGAKKGEGKTIGIILGKNKKDARASADIVIATGMNSARNIINVLSSDVIIGCGLGAGTASEISYAVKEKKPTILITDNKDGKAFFQGLSPNTVKTANTPEEVMELIEKFIS